MPEYLAPGVYVEETSFRAKSIEGVGTSVAGIVGQTRTGPVRGAPEVVTSYNEFERIYGDAGDLRFIGRDPVLNHTAIAARAFFDNGGKQLFVSRVIAGGNGTDDEGAGGTAQFAERRGGEGRVTFRARFPGSGGNITLRINWSDTQSLLRQTTIPGADVADAMDDDDVGLLRINARLVRTDFAGAVAAGDAQRPMTGFHSRA